MSLYVLDTDILSLYQAGHPAVCGHWAAHRPSDLATTVITVEEQLAGWYTLLRRARQPDQLARVYQRLADIVQTLTGLKILSFTLSAIARYDQPKTLRLNVRKNDLRIAAIVLENSAISVTRNVRDFQRVPNLVIEDWTT